MLSMRVIDPKQFAHAKTRQKRSKIWLILPLGLLVVGAFAVKIFVLSEPISAPNTFPANSSKVTNSADTQIAGPKPESKFKEFTGDQFKELYRSVAYPNIQQIVVPPKITDNEEADIRIRGLAEKRGYHLTAVPQGAIVRINEPRLEGDDLLQPLAAEGWQTLKAAATKEGFPISIISAYRSPEYQRDLFLQRLLANGTTARFIKDGIGDAAIQKTLGMTAVPGYSRHHTGYTIDLWCEDGSKSFLTSTCYQWISQNNYLHAKESGWIPSYPAGTDAQGPEPEPWEYVWVGTQNLTQ